MEGLNETYVLQFPCVGGGAEGGIQVAIFRSLQERSPQWEEMTSCLGALAPVHLTSWELTALEPQ